MTGASGLEQFVAMLLENHEDALGDGGGLVHRFRQEQAHRLAARRYAEMAEVDRRVAARTVSRLHRQLWLIDERMGGVFGRDQIEPAARALVVRSLGVRDDSAVEEAETAYAQLEEIRRRIPLAWSWKRARGTEPDDERMRGLEAELDVLGGRYRAAWLRWAGKGG